MSNLVVHDPGDYTSELSYVAHDPTRSAALASVVGTFAPGDQITFGTSGAVGHVVSWASPTLSFYLVSAKEVQVHGITELLLPWAGETITSGANSALVSVLADVGDTFENDGKTIVQASSEASGDVWVVVDGTGRCRWGLTRSSFLKVETGGILASQTLDRERFNASGAARLTYVGTTAAEQLIVAAFRAVPRG